jgi:hypothetical protein
MLLAIFKRDSSQSRMLASTDFIHAYRHLISQNPSYRSSNLQIEYKLENDDDSDNHINTIGTHVK